jgi:hypothetical protein
VESVAVLDWEANRWEWEAVSGEVAEWVDPPTLDETSAWQLAWAWSSL